MKKINKMSTKKIYLFFSYFLFISAFFISRYPFYQYFPIPQHIVQDGHLYYNTYRDILNNTGNFSIITAGYPLFIALAHSFSEKSISLVILQTTYCFLTCSYLIYVINKHFSYLCILVSTALSIFITQDNSLRYETSTFPDLIIAYTLILFIALIINTIKSSRKYYTFLLSLSTFFLILLKSSTVFTIIILLVLSFYLYRNNQKRAITSLIISTSILLLIYAIYNLFTINTFTILSSGRLKNLNKNITSDKENAFLAKVAKNALQNHPYSTLYFSSNPDEFAKAHSLVRWGAYLDSTNKGESVLKVRFEYDGNINIDSLFNQGVFSNNEINWFKQNKNSLYNKVFYIHHEINNKRRFLNLIAYLRNIQYKHHIFYLSEIDYRYDGVYVSKIKINYPYELSGGTTDDRQWLMREFYNTPQKTRQDFKNQLNKMYSNSIFKLYDIYNLYIGRPFTRHIIWFYIFIIISFLTFFLWLKQPNNSNYTILICIVLIHWGAASIHGVVVPNPLWRYSATTEFIPFISLALSPLLRVYFKKN